MNEERISWGELFLRAALFTVILLVPVFFQIERPEAAANLEARVLALPCGYALEAALIFVWIVALLGCLWAWQFIGRWFWVLGLGLLVALMSWACITDVINDAYIIPRLGEFWTEVVSGIWALLLCICVAGILFDGPKRRVAKGDGEIERNA